MVFELKNVFLLLLPLNPLKGTFASFKTFGLFDFYPRVAFASLLYPGLSY
jgi:hypothetical protein